MANDQGITDETALGRLMREKEFISFNLNPVWYRGVITGKEETKFREVMPKAESYGLEREAAGIRLGDPNSFIQFVNTHAKK